jgi:hypothetical protein
VTDLSRTLPDGRVIELEPQMFTWKLSIRRDADTYWLDDAY